MRLYGIKFGLDFQVCDSEVLQREDACAPEEYFMNIYFKDIKEAAKVTKFLKERNKDKYYTLYVTNLETLEKSKSEALKKEGLQETSPATYLRHVDYKIYDRAEDYLETLKIESDRIK